jgi:hypothetical protein
MLQSVSSAVASLASGGLNASNALLRAGGEILSGGPQDALTRGSGLIRGILATTNETGPSLKKVGSNGTHAAKQKPWQ